MIEMIRAGVEWEGFDYFFRSYTSIESFEKHNGPLPDDIREAWKAYVEAGDRLERLLAPSP